MSEVSRGTGLEPELHGELVQDVQVTHMAWLNVLSGDPRESLVQGGRFHGEASLFEESREPCMRGASHLCGARNGGRQSDTMLVEKRSLERERQRQSARWERELPLSKGRGGRGGPREDSDKASQRSRERGRRRERGEPGARVETAARQVNGQGRGDEGEKEKHRPGRGGNAPKSRGLQQNERGEKERGARRERGEPGARGGTPKKQGANGKTGGQRRTTREDESKHKEKRKREEPEAEKRTPSLRRERGTWWAPALSTPHYGMN